MMTDFKKFNQKIIITGGAGFIGSNLLIYLVKKYPDYFFINVDALTYAGNLSNLKSIENCPNYRFEHINICDYDLLKACFEKYNPTGVIHLAAESHVDRSIIGPSDFIYTNIIGTFNLLELARLQKNRFGSFRFHHVSTESAQEPK